MRTGDPEQRAAYSKEKDVALTASCTPMGARHSDTERIAQKLKEFRLRAEQSAADRLNRKMTIADPIVKSFPHGHSVAYFGQDSAGRQFRYLGLVFPEKIINIYAKSPSRTQSELETIFTQLLKGLSL